MGSLRCSTVPSSGLLAVVVLLEHIGQKGFKYQATITCPRSGSSPHTLPPILYGKDVAQGCGNALLYGGGGGGYILIQGIGRDIICINCLFKEVKALVPCAPIAESIFVVLIGNSILTSYA